MLNAPSASVRAVAIGEGGSAISGPAVENGRVKIPILMPLCGEPPFRTPENERRINAVRAEQLLHAAGAMYYFTNPAMGLKPPAAEDPKREQYKTKADIVAFVKKSFADGAAALQSKGEKGLTTEVVYFPQQKSRVLDIANGIIEHSGEHYGQLVVYYRLAGLVPPESRPKK
jgi:uncharacterized damage-inducible protein DinB